MTPNDVRRMFGDQACASIEGDQCILTPPGNQWLEQISKAMNGGHCEGMAVLSNLFYTGKANPADFGAATVPAATDRRQRAAAARDCVLVGHPGDPARPLRHRRTDPQRRGQHSADLVRGRP